MGLGPDLGLGLGLDLGPDLGLGVALALGLDLGLGMIPTRAREPGPEPDGACEPNTGPDPSLGGSKPAGPNRDPPLTHCVKGV